MSTKFGERYAVHGCGGNVFVPTFGSFMTPAGTLRGKQCIIHKHDPFDGYALVTLSPFVDE